MGPIGPAGGSPITPETILGIAPGATDRDIETAWRNYVMVHHPDRGGDAEAFALGRWARDALRGPAGAEPANQRPSTPGQPGTGRTAPRGSAPTRGAPSRRRLLIRRVRESLATVIPSLAPPPSRVD